VPAEPTPSRGRPATTLSYSALAEYERCGYRFYLERVLGLPSLPGRVAGEGALERGILVHELLERLDFRRPDRPAGVPREVADLVERFIDSSVFERLAAARDLRREEGFAFLVGDVLITGVLDAVATEPDGSTLIVDYKSDRLEGADPREVVMAAYGVQRLIYALAALRDGAPAVEVVHVFLERPDEPVSATFTDPGTLEHELSELAGRALGEEFLVAAEPWQGVCSGCPGEGGLCSWPLEMTRREVSEPVAASAEPQGRLF
jgi:hypothetical protein